MNKRLYFDMDNVLVDFQSSLDMIDEKTKQEYEGRFDEISGIFGLMKPMDGAVEAVHKLSDNMDVRRLHEITEKDVIRLRKYLHSWRYLKGLENNTELISD